MKTIIVAGEDVKEKCSFVLRAMARLRHFITCYLLNQSQFRPKPFDFATQNDVDVTRFRR